MKISLLLLGLVFGLVGCQSTERLYYWGDYEDFIHSSYSEPGTMSVERQLQWLQGIIAKADAQHLMVAPGIYAQLGVLAVENGQNELALQAFEKEAALYPESEVFIQYLVKTLHSSLAE